MTTLVGRKVKIPNGSPGIVVGWDPLGAGACDACVKLADRRVRFASSDLRPIDALGPLPDRQAVREAARVEQVRALEAIRAGLVTEIRERKPWPGLEHGKGILGKAIDGALASLACTDADHAALKACRELWAARTRNKRPQRDAHVGEVLEIAECVRCGSTLAIVVAPARVVRRHGEAPSRTRRGTAEHRAWAGMIQRCHNPKDGAYSRYGGRGIKVCVRWRRSYLAFLADVGRRPSAAHSIDRRDSNGDYKPSNVRWATRSEQQRNRRDTVQITIGGVTRPLWDWANAAGINYMTLHDRVKRGWPEARLLDPATRRRAHVVPRKPQTTLAIVVIPAKGEE